MSQKRKVTLYFNTGMLAETQKEALRQDRSVSWIMQAAWRLARDEMRRIPNSNPAPASVTPSPQPDAPQAGPLQSRPRPALRSQA